MPMGRRNMHDVNEINNILSDIEKNLMLGKIQIEILLLVFKVKFKTIIVK